MKNYNKTPYINARKDDCTMTENEIRNTMLNLIYTIGGVKLSKATVYLPSVAPDCKFEIDHARLVRRLSKLLIVDDGNEIEALNIPSIVQSYIESGRIWEFMQSKKPKSKTLFREYAEKWITEKEKKLENSTIESYQESLKVHILPVFGERYIEEITRDDIQKFMDDRRDYAKSSVELHWTLLKNILDLAIDDEIISKNVAKSPRLHNPATRVEKREALTEAQMADIASNLYKLNAQDQCMVALMLTIGGRRGEICGLCWEHVDFENNQVHIVQQADLKHKSRIKPPKNNSIGTVGLPQWVKEILLPYREKEGYIIYARKGKPLSESTFIKRMKHIEETINLYGASSHTFRHSAITALFHNGADTSDVQGFARHKNHTTTMNTYVHPRKEKVIEYRNVFDNIVNKDACFA